MYEDLEGGNIPALLDVDAYENSKKEQKAKIEAAAEAKANIVASDSTRVANAGEVRGDNFAPTPVPTAESLLADVSGGTDVKLTIQPVEKDSKNRSYNVLEDKINTAYRSWYLSYNYGDPEKECVLDIAHHLRCHLRSRAGLLVASRHDAGSCHFPLH